MDSGNEDTISLFEPNRELQGHLDRKNMSIVWKYMGKIDKEVNGVLTRVASCLHEGCNWETKLIASSTTNLRNHLRSHGVDLSKDDKDQSNNISEADQAR